MLTSLIRKSKVHYYNGAFDECRSDVKRTWILIKKLLNRTCSGGSVKSLLMNNAEIFDDLGKANVFSDFFSNIASKLDEALPNHAGSPIDYVTNHVGPSLFLRPITQSECSNIISELKNKSCPRDTLSVKLLKISKDPLVEPICFLINCSIEKETFPDILKLATVVPIYKSGDKRDPSNYRPISLLPLMSKIFERFIFKQLMSFFSEHSILTPLQFGFRRGCSTADAVMNLTSFIYDSLDKKFHSVALFIDFKKAFDTINVNILLEKLSCYGVRGTALNYISSYCRDRQQCVRIGEAKSDLKIVNIGIGQGTLLGPLLFLVYINDICNVSDIFNTVLFADDTCFVASHTDYKFLVRQVNEKLEKFRVWT